MRAVLLLSLLVPLAAAAQEGTLYVGVQRPDGTAVVGATVRLGERGASTDVEGLAAFEGVAPGRHTVRASFVGSLTEEVEVELSAPGPWALAVDLADDVALLGGVVVEGQSLGSSLDRSRLARDGFFRRQRYGFGTVLTADDFAQRGATSVSGALQGVAGVRTRRGAVGGAVATSSRGGCRMDVYLDGSPAPDLADDLDGIPIQDVVAVEVYNGLQVPVQYRASGRAGSACGVVLVWTRFSTLGPR